MTKMTEIEREEVAYMMWELNDGPSKYTAENKDKAEAYITDVIEPAGWDVLHREMVSSGNFDGTRCLRITIKRGAEARVLTWHRSCFFEASKHGGSSPANI